MFSEHDTARFWSKVNKSDDHEICWTWLDAPIQATGYGRFWTKEHGVMGAHRASYIVRHGAIPEGLHVLHKCHNRRCVNQRHLYAGTPLQNSHDMHLAGRRPGRVAKPIR